MNQSSNTWQTWTTCIRLSQKSESDILNIVNTGCAGGSWGERAEGGDREAH